MKGNTTVDNVSQFTIGLYKTYHHNQQVILYTENHFCAKRCKLLYRQET